MRIIRTHGLSSFFLVKRITASLQNKNKKLITRSDGNRDDIIWFWMQCQRPSAHHHRMINDLPRPARPRLASSNRQPSTILFSTTSYPCSNNAVPKQYSVQQWFVYCSWLLTLNDQQCTKNRMMKQKPRVKFTQCTADFQMIFTKLHFVHFNKFETTHFHDHTTGEKKRPRKDINRFNSELEFCFVLLENINHATHFHLFFSPSATSCLLCTPLRHRPLLLLPFILVEIFFKVR